MKNPLSALGDMQKLQQQARQMQQALQQEKVEVVRNGVRVIVRGDQQVLEVEIDGIIENRVAQAVNEAVQKTQQLAAQKLMELNQE